MKNANFTAKIGVLIEIQIIYWEGHSMIEFLSLVSTEFKPLERNYQHLRHPPEKELSVGFRLLFALLAVIRIIEWFFLKKSLNQSV